jgi:hypothetical protein
MSIVTLKKKTQTQYNNMSVGMKGFSINGTHRSQGYVGQTSLSRSLPKTNMKGNVACGHGGCCGTFRKMPIVQSAVISLNNPLIIKPSVVGTYGLIETKYRWIKRPQPFAIVKSDYNQNINNQSDYITNLGKQVITSIITYDSSHNINIFDKTLNQPCCKNVDAYLFSSKAAATFTKPASYFVPISAGEYLLQKHNNCSTNDITFVPSSVKYAPLPGPSKSY